MAALTKNFEFQFTKISLIPSDGGKFEIMIDGNTLYSKLTKGRHPETGEVERLVKEFLA